MKTPKNALTRKEFIKLTGMASTALFLGLYFPAKGEEYEVMNSETASQLGIELNAWITIDTTGKVTLTNHRAEMGQGSYQSVPQIIAEELEVDIEQVNIVFAQGSPTKYGSQVTGGSSTIRGSYKKLLKLSATAREMLKEAAAQKLSVQKSDCYAENGFVIHRPSGKKIGYGDLVEAASKLTPPKYVQLKHIDEYKIIRKPLPRQDTPLKVNGKAQFGIDKKIPGMLYAVVERNPRFVGKVKSFDDTETKKIKGVKHVFKVNREVFDHMYEGVAVVADNIWAAFQGRKALKIVWDDEGFEHYNTEQLYTLMREQLKSGTFLSYKTQGNFSKAYESSEKKLESLYETPYEAHSCMEPLNCIADVKEDSCEIWGPIQAPDWIQGDISKALKLPIEKVTVNLTFLGGGFGRKAFTDYPYEAVMISKQIKAPVQVIWSREDDTTAGPFRPGMIYQCKGAVNNGRIVALETKLAGQNMSNQNPNADKSSYNDSATEGLLPPYFDSIPHYTFGDTPLETPIPVMWWRSVYASTNGFAYESFIDELALASEKDPLDFRRGHLHNPRYQELIDKLEEVSSWKSREKKSGFGVAITECFSSIVGQVVKVSRNTNGKVQIDKVWAVIDCGWYVNPDIIQAQIEGSITMALGAATKHAIHFEDGKAVQKNFDVYKMPRIMDTPEVEVHIMENQEAAGGVGEPGLPPFTPALTNALFDLTGKRIRTLPFNLEDC